MTELHPHLNAPWTDEEVDSINRWQESGWVHPFTCPCDHDCFEGHVNLVATDDGLICPADSCAYTQSWVHGFMADDSIDEIEGYWQKTFDTVV